MRQRFRRIKLLCSMLIAGHPVTAPDIVAKFMFHIVEIVEGKKSLQLLFRDSDLYFLGFRLNDDPKFYVFANEELPEWIQRYTLPYGAGYDITVANVTLGPHCFDAIWKHMFEFTPKNYDTYDSDTRLILFWIMITMSETLRSRSLQEKVERTLETGVVEQVGALLDLKIHGWSHDSKDTFRAVSRNDMNWELLGSAGDLLTLKFSAPEALPVIIGRQKKVAEEAAAALAEISHLLEAHLCTNSDQAHNWEQLQHYSQLPNFNNYLIFLFAHAQEQSVQVRQAAGLVLKNNLRSTFSSMPPSSQSYIKSELLTCIGSPEKEIRSTAGTVTSVLLQIVGFDGWDYLFQTLRQCLGSDNLDQKEGAADAIYKICEDLPKDFNVDDDVSELVHDFMPRLLQLFECPSASLRKLALHCVNQCIVVLPSVLTMFRDQYLEGVLGLSAETSPDFKRLVCSSLTQLIELHQVIPEHHLKTAIEFVLHSTRDLDDNLAMEACKFWSVYCYSSMFPEGLQEVLEGLIQTLARNIVYTDKSILKILLDIKVNESISDRDQNLKRCFHASRLHGPEMGKVNDDDDDDDDDDAVNAWNLREYSAAGLECFSKALGNGILPILMPLIKANLVRSDDDAWKDREAAVLCIDTIAEGCMNGLQPHLPQIVPLLTLLLDDKYPLVRSITCQTISRYSKFIVQSGDHEQFVKIMKVLAKRILDANKRVHEAACSAFVTIGKEAAEFVGLETVLQHLMLDYGKHQTRDLHLISDAVGAKLNKTSCLDIIVNPLIMKWQQLQYSDKDLLPLLECFTSIAPAVGSGCSQFAEVVFKKCLKLIDFQQLAKADPAAPSFIVCSLDLLSGLAEALGAGIENLVGQSNLIEVLMHCCKDETAGVRRSALALLGKLSRICHTHVHSNLQEFLKVAAEQLTWVSVKVATPVANCACWVIGELAIKFGQEIAPTVTIILSGLVPIVRSSEGLDKIFVGNSAIALGRLSLFFPEIVSSRMKRSMQAWCNALCIRTGDNLEREEAFSGLCSVVEANPARAVGSLSDVCKAFATLQDIQSKELGSKVCRVLNDVKQEHASGRWEQCMGTLDPSEVHRLATLMTVEQQIGQSSQGPSL